MPDAAAIERAAERLRAGQLVAIPTETVYGLAANALDPAAVQRIFDAKGRPQNNPLIIHVANTTQARELAAEWPQQAEALAYAFWPGPLTIVVPKKPHVPDLVTAGLSSVALRMPAHPVARAVIEAAGLPLAAPSANRFTQLSPTTAQHVEEGLGESAGLILDGGPCTVGIESTVISLTSPTPRILRPGMISRAQIEAVIGPVEEGAGAESPGQHPKHYSPRTTVFLDAEPRAPGRGARIDFTNMPNEPAAYAEQLYARLHDLDRESYDWISIEMPPDTPEWRAVRDRLKRAATR